MDNLMKAAENFAEKSSMVEKFDESLFIDFMKKVPIWEYYSITKQAYLLMSESEKREKISKYYSDMKIRHVAVGEFNCVFFFVFCSFYQGLLTVRRCLFKLDLIKKFLEVTSQGYKM